MPRAFIFGRLRRRNHAADKRHHELAFWRQRQAEEGTLGNAHYEYLFTEAFGLDPTFYAGKRLLDIGCGPRGSLEWAAGACERVGVDPLAGDYRQLGTEEHQMRYEQAGAEHLPFADGHFDVVSTFNSLDHVDDLDETLREIRRVLRPGGSWLVIVEVGHEPTATEPVSLWWDLVERLQPHYDVSLERHYEMSTPLLHWSVAKAVPFDEASPDRRPAVLVAHFLRRSGPP